MKIYFTSDTHFNHEMLIREQKRPFKSVDEMNKLIINNWNKVVNYSEDIIYHLGDVSLNKKLFFDESISPKLNGKIIYIKGNHDSNSISHIQNMIILFEGKLIELVHRPQDALFGAKIILHGHIHNNGNIGMVYKGEFVKPYIFKTEDGVIFYNVNLEFHKYKPKLINDILGEIDSI